MRRLVVVLFLAPVLALAAPAPPTRLVLLTEAGAGTEACPSAKELASDVSAKLGYDPFREDAARRVVVRFSTESQGLRARVQLFNEQNQSQGERELTSQEGDCRELASSVAFAVSVALDPVAAIRPPPAASSAPPAASSSPPAAVSAPPPAVGSALPPPVDFVSPTQPTSSPPGLRLAIGAQAAFAAAPAIAPGLIAQVGVRWPSTSISLEGRLDLPASRATDSGRVESSLLLGSLVPCAHISVLFGCVLLSMGGLRGSGSGVDEPRTATTFFAALGPRVGVNAYSQGPFSLRLWTDLLVPLTRTRLSIDGKEAWRTPSLSSATGLGLEFRFL